jgi:hypothetical protein
MELTDKRTAVWFKSRPVLPIALRPVQIGQVR